MNDPNSGVRVGMEVVGADGVRIGQVRDLRQRDFLVDLDLQDDSEDLNDLFIPYDAVQVANADQLRLSIMSDQVDRQGWRQPKEGRQRGARL